MNRSSYLDMRILRDPAPAPEGAGGTPPPGATPPAPATPPAAPPAAATPPATPPAAPAAPVVVTVTAEEYRHHLETKAKLDAIEAENRKQLEAAENARLKLLAEKGEGEKALNELRANKDKEIATANARADALEAERLADRKEAALLAGLAGFPYASEEFGPLHVRTILDSRFESVRDSAGQVQVREKGTNRPAADALKAWRDSPEAAGFKKASSQGGTGARGGASPAPAGGEPQPEKPLTFADRLLLDARAKAGLPPADTHIGLAYRPPVTSN